MTASGIFWLLILAFGYVVQWLFILDLIRASERVLRILETHSEINKSRDRTDALVIEHMKDNRRHRV